MACKCLEQMQEQLKERGVALTREMVIDLKTSTLTMSPPCLRVHKLESKSRVKVPTIFCTFCPCCGKKYEQRAAKPAKKARSK